MKNEGAGSLSVTGGSFEGPSWSLSWMTGTIYFFDICENIRVTVKKYDCQISIGIYGFISRFMWKKWVLIHCFDI